MLCPAWCCQKMEARGCVSCGADTAGGRSRARTQSRASYTQRVPAGPSSGMAPRWTPLSLASSADGWRPERWLPGMIMLRSKRVREEQREAWGVRFIRCSVGEAKVCDHPDRRACWQQQSLMSFCVTQRRGDRPLLYSHRTHGMIQSGSSLCQSSSNALVRVTLPTRMRGGRRLSCGGGIHC